MKLPRCVIFIPLALIAMACAQRRAPLRAAVDLGDAAEFRALWVDGFHAGIRSAKEVAQLIEDAKRANVNTLIVQVRRRALQQVVRAAG
jgi:uncharacterized lipoprotein YddW (UPF0748 family)